MSTIEILFGLATFIVTVSALRLFYRLGYVNGEAAGWREGHDAAKGRRAAILKDYRELLEKSPMEGGAE